MNLFNFTLVALSLCFSYAIGDDCRPESHGKSFLIGYGSLMNEQSLNTSIKDHGAFEPVEVKGFRRSFDFTYNLYGLKSAMLAVYQDESSSMNAVIIELDEKDIAVLDKRESGYCRKQVASNAVKLYSDAISLQTDTSIWIYVAKEAAVDVDDSYLIPQSYIDLFLGGCIALEKEFSVPDFAKSCVLTTHQWDQRYVVNDRIYPRRPWSYQPMAMKVDKLLDENAPNVIENRRFER